ncbi:hypothetical protein ACFT30_18435 [Microbacterium ureisolvens]|uniref:hypothetical protein n=1 Tax=Microbacterium ureisolvens TaxID=2781186 RepID=UPI00362F23A8
MTAATDHRPIRVPRLSAVILALAGVALTGCTASQHEAEAAAPDSQASAPADPTPEPAAAVPAGDAISGVGPIPFPGMEFPIPEGARSVVVDFECAGAGYFSVELGDSMMMGQAPVSGHCDGISELAWPITELTDGTLSVAIPDGVPWVATPTFSADEFGNDGALAADCSRFAEIYSAFFNADSGYTHYSAFDATEWASRVDRAVADLSALAASSQSELRPAFGQLRGLVAGDDRTVGAIVTVGVQAAIAPISEACNKNQTPLILTGEFGG